MERKKGNGERGRGGRKVQLRTSSCPSWRGQTLRSHAEEQIGSSFTGFHVLEKESSPRPVLRGAWCYRKVFFFWKPPSSFPIDHPSSDHSFLVTFSCRCGQRDEWEEWTEVSDGRKEGKLGMTSTSLYFSLGFFFFGLGIQVGCPPRRIPNPDTQEMQSL